VRARLRIRAHATHPLNTHAIVWLVLATAMFAQPVGLIAADTKHDLTADPAGFLAAATHAWTDVFPLGQLQNQAYGYLFPQGLFFLLADAIPDWLLPTWVAQRLWWTIVVGVGFSGFYRLCQCVVPGSDRAKPSASIRAFQIIAALLFALSPRTLTTLTAISSEAWPVMLAPWVLVPLLRTDKITGRDIAAATIPIALMGAVNATATLAACIPAGLVILWRRQGWLLLPAAVAVSAWWIGPLLVLGKYSPPFTDFIESSYVTTRWLNLLEILRGTTHWTPFADTEREAGYLLVSQPVFVLATVAIAACGLAGLALSAQGAQGSTPSTRLRYHGLWLLMLLVGITILAAPYGQLLDNVLTPLRNLHKFDPLVRIPLLLGVAHLGAVLEVPRLRHPLTRRAAAGLGVAVIALLSVAPVWSGRLLPTGAYREVPEYWRQAADFLNDNVDTRTLLVPETSFARQEWGWTRDEPAQPLLDVPWAVRDAVPLLPPEAIRGLDGVLATLDRSVDPLLRLGIGAVLVRHDLDSPVQRERADELADALDRAVENSPASSAVQRHDFGDPDSGGVSVFVLDAQRDMHIAHDPVTVAGGGEALAVLDAIDGPAPRRLVDHAGAGAAKEGSDAEIVTDTPLLVDRNFGTLQGAVSGPLASPDEATTKHPSVDYPSVATPLPVRPRGDVQLQASSSAADATAFGGADPARSVNAAVDGTDQAWWPAPGDPGTLQLRSTNGTVDAPELHLTTTEHARLRVLAFADGGYEGADEGTNEVPEDDSASTSDEPIRTITVETAAGEDTRVAFPDDLRANRIEVQLNPETRTGVSDIHLAGHELSRLVHVPATANARQFVFQRLAVDTGVVQRSFEVPRTMQLEIRTDDEQPVTIDGTEYSAGETVELSGTHTISTAAAWVSLREPGFAPTARYEPVAGRTVPGAVDAEDAVGEGRLLVTGRAFNEGLRGELVDASGTVTELQPTSIDAATQAFVLPAGASGEFRMSFAGEATYRMSLFVGAAVSLVTLAALVLFPLARPTANTQFAAARRRHARRLLATEPTLPAWAFPVAAVAVSGAVVGPAGAVSAAAAWAITRWTTIRPVVLAPALLGICGLWLARAPWPDVHYAGDSLLVACLAAGAVACLSQSRAGSSTKV
jgi:hypothetical protein